MLSKEKAVCIGSVEAGNMESAENAVIPANYSVNNTKSGHGIMAEEAQTIIDRLRGKAAEVVGRDNAKNGADRLVDGVRIQTKFYNSGRGCVAACFDSDNGGMYKYLDDGGRPMPVEVPKDMYNDAVREFRRRIAGGKVPGVTDESLASDYVRAADLTYDQAVRLCTPLTWESLLYDCAVGAVRCLILFFVTAAAVFLMKYRTSRSGKPAAKAAVKAGAKAFGLSYAVHIICSQFARTALFKAFAVPSPDKDSLFAGAVSVFDIGMKTGAGGGYSSLSGAVGRFPKMLKAGMLAALITLIVFAAAELAAFMRGKISGAELGINIGTIILSKTAAVLFYAAASVILAYYALLPAFLNIAVCIAAAMLGGLFGRGIAVRLTIKFRRGESA